MPSNDADPEYQRPDLPVSRRVSDLLDRMTVEEKAGQLVGTWAGQMHRDVDVEEVAELVRENHLGCAAPFGWGGSAGTEVGEIVDIVNDLQRVATEETRLGIPLFFNVDAVHGHAYVAGSAVFPNGLGAAATWDPELVEAGARVTATEVAATGAHQNYGPTCDVGRDPRWGRVFETFGESPRLVAEMAAAKVRGYQGEGLEADDTVVATAKHFPAYSEPERGEDAAPVDVSEYKLRNTFVPPFEAALDEGVESVMPCYNSINGEPVHGSERWLTDLLRGDLGFDGTIVSDWGGVRHLTDDHKTAADLREATYDARTAGLDVASVGNDLEQQELVDLVESGDLSESVLDSSVERVLERKFRMGLFEDPYVEKEAALETVGSDDHQGAALETAREAMTLLKNDDCLPLSGEEDVFVGGPNADDLVSQVGGWSVEREEHVDGTTIAEEIRAHVDGEVTYEQGTTHSDRLDVDAAAEKAAEADVAVLALGEGWYLHEFGAGDPRTETGEFPTRERIALGEAQQELVEAVAETGTPVVGVLVTGRPLAVEHLDERAEAVLMAYFPGTMGGKAVAETLVGENNPSGRLAVTVPRSGTQVDVHHDHLHQPRPIGDSEHPDSYDPLYPFGHGLSYTAFETGGLSVDEAVVRPGDTVELDVTVENVGDRPGSEVVQAYSETESKTLVMPERRLQAFERVELDAGERATVTVEVPVENLGVYAPGDGHRVEAGDYDLVVGDESVTVTVDGDYL
ncbi:glycoside hydrolase family 3 C-terminal domain-containing protein [Halosimplex rubrum]|uniref:beta-glucosidase n=1 Tax=Halosimplex rubrum TaxID=869889 RepID=A0A7D5P6I6_9EURY|nr:glycoside hydrolase family 3 N-terminal domain-containing protein [Halosimplex rubrum]QLH79724.1 glycoside hydrolase family 3 C-terminal domain-containing protein [Halosimplex rubrum]